MSLFPCQSVTSLVKQLHARDSRRRFCADEHWLSPRAAVSHETLKISVLLDGDEDNESEGTYLLISILFIWLFQKEILPSCGGYQLLRISCQTGVKSLPFHWGSLRLPLCFVIPNTFFPPRYIPILPVSYRWDIV